MSVSVGLASILCRFHVALGSIPVWFRVGFMSVLSAAHKSVKYTTQVHSEICVDNTPSNRSEKRLFCVVHASPRQNRPPSCEDGVLPHGSSVNPNRTVRCLQPQDPLLDLQGANQPGVILRASVSPWFFFVLCEEFRNKLPNPPPAPPRCCASALRARQNFHFHKAHPHSVEPTFALRRAARKVRRARSATDNMKGAMLCSTTSWFIRHSVFSCHSSFEFRHSLHPHSLHRSPITDHHLGLDPDSPGTQRDASGTHRD